MVCIAGEKLTEKITVIHLLFLCILVIYYNTIINKYYTNAQ